MLNRQQSKNYILEMTNVDPAMVMLLVTIPNCGFGKKKYQQLELTVDSRRQQFTHLV